MPCVYSFGQSYDYTQDTPAHETKITIASINLRFLKYFQYMILCLWLNMYDYHTQERQNNYFVSGLHEGFGNDYN